MLTALFASLSLLLRWRRSCNSIVVVVVVVVTATAVCTTVNLVSCLIDPRQVKSPINLRS